MKHVLAVILFVSSPCWATQFQTCPSSDNAVTSPAPVQIEELKASVHALQDQSGKKFFTKSPQLDQDIENTFDITRVKTKMEQFYTLLWNISQELSRQEIKTVSFSKQSVQKVLLTSKVFTDPSVPNRIQSIQFDLEKEKAKTTVAFDGKDIDVPLNQGEGFYLFRNGKCQHAQKLIFDQNFSFELKKNLGNLMVRDFKGVDLFGDFGNRGMIDVDIQYVSLRSVEFLSGTVNGRVTAYVSREEFSKNEHNALLEIVTKIVPDRSVQPIDW